MSLKVNEFTATGTSEPIWLNGWFNASISGTFVATIALERKLRGETAWIAIDTFTAPVSKRGFEAEVEAEYRFNCTAYTSGTARCRLAIGGASIKM